MGRPRKHLVCVDQTPYYHVISRCVRRAYLCGVDQLSGRSYEHRRGWIERRLRLLSSLFSVELCAYAVMSNHYHLVVRLNPDLSAQWTDDDVLARWSALYRGPLLVQRHRAGDFLNAAERDAVRSMAAVYRQRLGSLSWFMKCLNEPIARQANAEDGCTGHFWEARFYSQSLRSEAALLTAMAYVDLNPVRAGFSRTPEQSEYTSIRARIRGPQTDALGQAAAQCVENRELRHFDVPVRPLMPFCDELVDIDRKQHTLPMKKQEYLKLVDQTGRFAVYGKRGRIDPSLAPILARLGLTEDDWLQCTTAFRQNYRNGHLRLRQSV